MATFMFAPNVIIFTTIFASVVWAQSNMAQCGPGFDWNKNSLGQDPCTVGSALDASCRGTPEYTYAPLNASMRYIPPRTNHTGDMTCDCNTVMYSLYMACASCQGGEIYSWLEWITECVLAYVTLYPGDVPPGIAVPRWAYDDVTAKTLPNMTYNGTVAMNIGRDPETFPRKIITTATESSSTTGSSSTMGMSIITKSSTALPIPTNTDNTVESRNHVRAIVGGVVGSIVPFTVLAVVASLYMRKRKLQRDQPPEAEQVNDPQQRSTIPSYWPSTSSVPLSQYNPADPSTFPSDPPTFPQNSSGSANYSDAARGVYSGVAEI